MNTRLLPTASAPALDLAVAEAVDCLRAGDPVALPTETVYGLAADALRPEAVVKIFEAKERPFFDPLICHLPDRDWLEIVTDIPPSSRPLVEALTSKFWPGPLTLVLPRRELPLGLPINLSLAKALVSDLVTSGLPTVAVRMPAHPVFRAVLTAFGKPLAAPSANRFGRISPTAAEHVRKELGGRIPLILDGGPTEHGLESTIVKVEGGALTILRAGPVTRQELDAALREAGIEPSPSQDGRTGLGGSLASPGRPEAPGQLKSHYAPRTPLLLGTSLDVVEAHRSKIAERPLGAYRLGLLAFQSAGERAGDFACVEILSPTGDLREAAATLFAKMRRLDEAGLTAIIAEPVPEHGLGIAIMDRLRKAAAEHVH